MAPSAIDALKLQSLVEQCADYYTLVEGAPAGPDEAHKLLTELPPGCTPADKFLFDLGDGVLEIVRGYREAGDWWLGLLLLAPSARAKGRGAAAVAELFEWLRPLGAKRVLLAVAEQNEAALRFWQRHGFTVVKRHPARQMAARETVLLELQREL